MGFESRDYARDGRYSDAVGGWGFSGLRMPPVCKYLILANILVFLLQIFITREPTMEDFGALPTDVGEQINEFELLSLLPRISVVQEWLQLETDKVFRSGQIWRLLTCAFLHDRMGIWHIVINMLFLFWFGRALEAMYGSREFLLFYLAGALASSVAYVGLDLITGESVPAIGASGAVMAVTMLYAIHYPRHTILLFFIIPIQIRWIVLIYVLFDLHPVLLALAGDPTFSGVAHAAHLGGLAFGFLYWKLNLKLAGWLPLRKRGRPPPGWSVVREPDEIDRSVDEILQKISEQGELSLTDEERKILKDASRRRR